MQVTVQYAAQARQAAGRPAETLEFAAPPTVADLLQALRDRHGDALATMLRPAGPARRLPLLIIKNDQRLRPDDPAPLQDGDVICLLPPLAGG